MTIVASTSYKSRLARFASTGSVFTTVVALCFCLAVGTAFSQQGAAPQSQGSTSKEPSPDVARKTLSQYFRAVRSAEIQGEELTLERAIYGVYNAQSRYQRLRAYWDFAGKNAYYNLCVACSSYAKECADKVQSGATPDVQSLSASAQQTSLARLSAARLQLIQTQYDYDAAFTTAAGRRAAIMRAATSGVRTLDPTQTVVFYIPSTMPTTDAFKTRYEQYARNYRGSSELARLNALLPLLYETLQARAGQATSEFNLLVTLIQSSQVSPTSLFTALDRYQKAMAETIDAAVKYNQAIAAYASSTVPGSIQGAQFLATINQLPSAGTTTQQPRQTPPQGQQPPQQNQPQTSPTQPPQGQPGTFSQTGRVPSSGASIDAVRIDLTRSSKILTSPRSARTSREEVNADEHRVVSTSSDVADSQVAPLASIQATSANQRHGADETAISAITSHNKPSASLANAVASERVSSPAADVAQPSKPTPSFVNSGVTRPTGASALVEEPSKPTDVAERTFLSDEGETSVAVEPSGRVLTDATTADGVSTAAEETRDSKSTSPHEAAEPTSKEEPADDAPQDKDGGVVASANVTTQSTNYSAPLPPEFYEPLYTNPTTEFPHFAHSAGHESDLFTNPASASEETTREPNTTSESPEPATTEEAYAAPVLETVGVSLRHKLIPLIRADSAGEWVIRGQELDLLDDFDADNLPADSTVDASPTVPSTAEATTAPAPSSQQSPTQTGAQTSSAYNAAVTTSDAVRAPVQSGAASTSTDVPKTAPRVRELVDALFLVESPKGTMNQKNARGVYERIYTLHEAISQINQSPSNRAAVAQAFWKLQGACARLRVEEIVFQNYSLVYNTLSQQTGQGTEATQASLAAALTQQARVAKAAEDKRAAQTELLRLMGLNANAAYPLPGNVPFAEAYFNFGTPTYLTTQTRRAATLARERLATVQKLGATLDAPSRLLSIDVNGVSASNSDVALFSLEKKREAALLFIDHVVQLNLVIAEYVAFFPATASSAQFADAIVGR